MKLILRLNTECKIISPKIDARLIPPADHIYFTNLLGCISYKMGQKWHIGHKLLDSFLISIVYFNQSEGHTPFDRGVGI